MYHTIKTSLKNNKKVIENYSFMTILQFTSMFIGLVTYPYVLKTLGAEFYGLYVFIFSSSILFGVFISFSMDLLATKEIAQNVDDIQKKSEIVSSVIFARLILFGLAFIVLLLLSSIFSFITEHFLLYILCFLSNIGSILFHPWYFQGIQKMKVVTYIQLGFKVLSLPFIFILINSKNDLTLYIIILLLTSVLSACYGFYLLLAKEKIKLYWCGFETIKQRLKISLPFFYTRVLGDIRGQAIPQIMGAYIGMHEVALYDLAQKIFKIPYSLVANVNSALFPKLAQHRTEQTIHKLFKYEWLLGLSCIIAVVVFGQFAVEVLGGKAMAESYYLTVILSLVILLDLLISMFLSFVFVLNDKNKLVYQAQIIAFIGFFAFIFVGLYFYKNAYVFAMAMVFAGVAELVFCHWNYRKIKNEIQKIQRSSITE